MPYVTLDDAYMCSGHRAEMQFDLHQIFQQNISLFNVAYQIDNYLFTHAGVSAGWYEFNKEIIELTKEKFECKNLVETLNAMFESNESRLALAQVGTIRNGFHKWGGIFWADKRETLAGPLKGFHQYVGHTPTNHIFTHPVDENTTITYCDVLPFKMEFKEINL
jgi:hypothetical protein